MPSAIWNVEWLNANSQRAFPFADWAALKDRTGTITIPSSFLVAAYIATHAGLEVEPDKFYLKTLGIYPTGFNLAFAYDDGSGDPPVVAAVNVATATHTENRSYPLAGVDDFDDATGKVAVGTLDAIAALPPGQYVFDPAATAIEPDCIRPMIRGISSVVVVNGLDRSPRIYGDIELVAGNNMRIVVEDIEGSTPRIIFNAISGEGLNEVCVCNDDPTSPPIRFINGIPPLLDGNFRILGDDCLDVQPITNGLQLVDKCSKPCCGCTELDALIQQSQTIADGVATFSAYITNLSGMVTQMNSLLLGSRLNDAACNTC